MNLFGQGRNRQPVVAGSFYPASGEKLRGDLAGYFASFSAPGRSALIRAIIVPHAGYIYSGHTAAAGFAAIPAEAEYDNIFLIGVSHRYGFDGAAVFTSGDLVTPLGTLRVNRELGEQLKSTGKWFITRDDAHGPEHSLEVQLPFIQYHFKKVPPVIPILIGTRNTNILKALATSLQPWFNERNLFVISSDFSHYPSYEDARYADRLASDAIIRGDPNGFLRTIREIESSGTAGLVTAMCGWPAGLVLLYMTEKSEGLRFRNVEYTNSGDSPIGSRSEVVGYNAIILEKRGGSDTGSDAASGRPGGAASTTATGFRGSMPRGPFAYSGTDNCRESGSRPAAATGPMSGDTHLSATASDRSAPWLTAAGEPFTLTPAEKRTLLEIARESIMAQLDGRKPAAVSEARLTPKLKEPLGAFVTITKKGQLRGCIGRFTATEPLWLVVSTMAGEAAFSDPRFTPLKRSEYPSIEIEISVLGPMQKISDISEIRLGHHGIYIRKGYRSGTFLPQVADGRDWSTEEFLSYCSRDKAGIGWDGWRDKDTEIFVYEALVFSEKETP